MLFVCLGNICRSPLAEGIFAAQVSEAGLSDHFDIDSAGTGSWHAGQLPDARMRETARGHGTTLVSRARQFVPGDFSEFDHILVMDRSNQSDVLASPGAESGADRVQLFRDYDPEPGDGQVPDPYYGGSEGFETVYSMVERTSSRLLAELTEQYDLSAG